MILIALGAIIVLAALLLAVCEHNIISGGAIELFRKYESLGTAELDEVQKLPQHKQPMSALPREITQLPTSLKYHPQTYRIPNTPKTHRTSLHLGQRKLLLSEIDFLTDHANPGDLVVYAGAAPGDHIMYLVELFKHMNLKYVLYDPRNFNKNLATDSAIHIQQKYFLESDAAQYVKYNDRVLLISDIRTAEDPSNPPDDTDIRFDNELQRNWTTGVNARHSMLKFRFGFTDQIVPYLEGEVRLQVWGPGATTETRLVVPQNAKIIDYDNADYDARMYYIATIIREWVQYDHGVDITTVPGLCYCYDCSAEIFIWSKYLRTINKGKEEIPKYILQTSKELGRGLFYPRHPHGHFPEETMSEKRSKLPIKDSTHAIMGTNEKSNIRLWINFEETSTQKNLDAFLKTCFKN